MNRWALQKQYLNGYLCVLQKTWLAHSSQMRGSLL